MASNEIKNSLDGLKQFTTVVADTGDFESIGKYKPQDATTNPSLLLKALNDPKYSKIVDASIEYGKSIKDKFSKKEVLSMTADNLFVRFGLEILKIVPGRVSTEIDARLSFNIEETVKRAQEIIKLYKAQGIETEKRVLIKIASTWEGLQAAEILEKQGIHCNLTLMFSTIQAEVSGQVGATLISPFVGRITDYFKAKLNKESFSVEEDPGILAVKQIFTVMKQFYPKTEVMGASFRSKDQVIALAGCDLLTVSPTLLDQIQNENKPVKRQLIPSEKSDANSAQPSKITQDQFLFKLNSDEMAHFKLAEGIRRFVVDQEKLESSLAQKIF